MSPRHNQPRHATRFLHLTFQTDFHGPCAINCTNDREVCSFHPTGANVVFADGSVHFLQAGLSIRVFARLVTRAGGEVVSGGDF